MTWAGAFFRWLGTPVRACRSLFPFTHAGRQTLIYLVLAMAGPALTAVVMWAMEITKDARQWAIFGSLADRVAWSLFVIVCALACFVSIRAIRIGKDGASMESRDIEDAEDVKSAVQAPATAAQLVADDIKAKIDEATSGEKQ